MNTSSIHKDGKAFAKVQRVIDKHGAALAGVVEVWAGYKFRAGKLTREPAVLVIMDGSDMLTYGGSI